MRVLHINCNYIGTTLHQLMIEKLDDLGVENQVFVPTYDKRIAVIEPNANVCVCECFKKWDRIVFDYKQRKIQRALEKQIHISEFNVIHAYTLFTDGNCARRLSQKYGIPYVVAIRNTDVNDFFRLMPHLRKRGVEIMRDASAVFFLSESYRKQVFDKYISENMKQEIQKKTYIIPNGIDDFWFSNLYTDRDLSEAEHRIQQKQIRLVYAGGIDRNKNITTTCEAIELLKKEGWAVDFTVVGKVKDQRVFEEIKDKVKYLPARPKEELITVYRNADIFVMPSHHETFGLVYAEAMSQGLPVVYSKGQGFDGQFPEGAVGIAVDSSSPESVAKGIRENIDNYSQIAQRCSISVKKYDWKTICQEYLTEYRKIVTRVGTV